MLLASPKRNREIACDKDGMVVNAWRGIQNDPDAVAFYADYPTYHDDLTARRYWLADWRDHNREQLTRDPLYYDAQAAGWWIYCVSSWIGGAGQMLERSAEKRPFSNHTGGGQGVQVQRSPAGLAFDKRPLVKITGTGVQASRRDLARDRVPRYRQHSSGTGVQVQRRDMTAGESIPKVGIAAGGTGVQAQRREISSDGIGTGKRLSDWMYALADRLAAVVILNRDWSSAVTPTLLQHTPTAPKPPVGVFLDPPYLEDSRSVDLYEGDGRAENPAEAAYRWALEHGDVYRIAYACHEGDFEVPDGWEAITRTFSGIKDAERLASGKDDLVMFSPACVFRKPEQVRLL